MRLLPILATVLVLPILTACSTTTPPPTPPVAVKVATATAGSVAEGATLTGTLAPAREVTVAALAPGRLAAVTAAVGDHITAGQILARVETAHADVAVADASAQIAAAKATRAQIVGEFAARLATALAAVETARANGSAQSAAAQAALDGAQADRSTQLNATLTEAAATLTATADTLDQLLGVTPANEQANASFDRYLGALDSAQKNKTKEMVRQFLPLARAFRAEFDAALLPGQPTAAALGVAQQNAETALLSAKNALAETHTLLLKTITAADFSTTELETKKQAVFALGDKTEKVLTALRTASATGGTRGDVATLTKKATEAKTAAASAIRLAERTVRDVEAAQTSALSAVDAQIVALTGGQKTAAVNVADSAAIAGISGVITQKLAEVGQVVAAGTPLFVLASESDLKVIAAAPPSVAPWLHAGQTVQIAVEGHPVKTGAIAKITPTADTATGNLPVEITLPASSNLKPGMFAQVSVALPRLPGLLVPRTAVVERYARTLVFVVTEGKVAAHDVTLGAENNGFVVVASGLSAGAKVVTEGSEWLRDGDSVVASSQ